MSATTHPFALGVFEFREPIASGRPSGGSFVGAVVADLVWPVQALPGFDADGCTSIHDLLSDWSRCFPRLQLAVAQRHDRDALPVAALRALAPLPQSRQVICTGANYRQHVIDLVVAQGSITEDLSLTADERRARAARRVDERAASGIPYAFPKLVSALAGPQDDLVIPRDATQLDWELELGVVIGRSAWRVPREQALEVVAGYVMVNDITRRELVYRDDMKSIGSDWLRAKSGPGFMPHGPYFVPAAFVPDPHQLHLRLEVNGQVMQDETTADMLFGVERQIAYVSSFVRLSPGDILATGSPAGNGMHHGRFLQPGDVMTGTITGLGTQTIRCVAEA